MSRTEIRSIRSRMRNGDGKRGAERRHMIAQLPALRLNPSPFCRLPQFLFRSSYACAAHFCRISRVTSHIRIISELHFYSLVFYRRVRYSYI